MGLFERMLELSNQGFACAQIMMQLVLDAEEKPNPDLIRSLGALNDGLRGNAQLCGALTGAACVLSYYAGQGQADELPDPAYDSMTQQLFAWFEQQAGSRYGGISCPQILGGDAANKPSRCPQLVEDSFAKAIALLEEHDLL